MDRAAPHVITALVFASAAAWSAQLAVDSDPFAPSSAAVVAIGLVLFALISITGLLLSRGRWSRNLSLSLVAATLLLAVVLRPGPWYSVGLATSALALIGLTGPWLDGWVRKLPSAEGPGTKPIVLVFIALALAPATGVASPSGLEVAHGVLGGAGILFGWGYARTEAWGFWGLRLAVPVLAVPPVIQSPWGGRALIAAMAAAVIVLAWSRDAQRAMKPLLDRLPGPRVAAPPSASSEESPS